MRTRTERTLRAAGLALTSAFAALSANAQTGASAVKVSKDLVYARHPGKDGLKPLLLDVYEPATCGARRPLLLFVHGGGFVGGSKDDQPDVVRMMNYAVERGYVAASINYRLKGDKPVLLKVGRAVQDALRRFPDSDVNDRSVTWSAAVEDGVTAIRWLSNRAGKHCIDPARVAVSGGSAGAITAMHIAYFLDDAGLKARKIKAVIDLWGAVTDPETVLQAGHPPLAVIHGTADETISFDNAVAINAAAGADAIPSQLIPVEGAGHGFGQVDIFAPVSGDARPLVQRAFDFIAPHMGLP